MDEKIKTPPKVEKPLADSKIVKAEIIAGMLVVLDDVNIVRYPQVVVTGDLPTNGDIKTYDVGENILLTGTVYSSDKTNMTVVLKDTSQKLKGQ